MTGAGLFWTVNYRNGLTPGSGNLEQSFLQMFIGKVMKQIFSFFTKGFVEQTVWKDEGFGEIKVKVTKHDVQWKFIPFKNYDKTLKMVITLFRKDDSFQFSLDDESPEMKVSSMQFASPAELGISFDIEKK